MGIKAVNALSSRFEVRSYRDGKVRTAIFEKGTLLSDVTEDSTEESGTYIFFEPDATQKIRKKKTVLTSSSNRTARYS